MERCIYCKKNLFYTSMTHVSQLAYSIVAHFLGLTLRSRLITQRKQASSMNRKRLLGTLAIVYVAVMNASVHAAPIFAPGDPIVAIWNTSASGNSTASTAGTTAAGQYPAGEAAPNAIDGVSTTKYLNFGGGGGGSVSTGSKGVGTGFYATPSLTDTIVDSLRFTAANDAVDRDPLTITLEGSNGGDLSLGTSCLLYTSDAADE